MLIQMPHPALLFFLPHLPRPAPKSCQTNSQVLGTVNELKTIVAAARLFVGCKYAKQAHCGFFRFFRILQQSIGGFAAL
jgi:hypothetical protein